MYWFDRLFRKQKSEDQLRSELQFHVEQQTANYAAQGMPIDQARRRAQMEFGGTEAIKEQCRESRRIHLLETLLQDLRYGLRSMRRSPGFTTVAILTLALGMGANTAIFSIVHGVLLSPLPFPDPDKLVLVNQRTVYFERGSISWPNFQDWQRENRVFSSMAAYRPTSYSLTGTGDAELLMGQMVSASFFPQLGISPIAGRNFVPEEDKLGASPVAIITEQLWRRKFSASPDVIGKVIRLDGTGYLVIGVVPASFHLLLTNFRNSDVFVPIDQWSDANFRLRKNAFGTRAIARLKPGVTLAQAQADMDRISHNLELAYPDTNTGVAANLGNMKEGMVRDSRPFLVLLLSAVGFVLLIACANVANLLLARSTSRMREFSIRAALGASHSRVVRQLLTESTLLSLGGAALGLLVAWFTVRSGLLTLAPRLPRLEAIRIDSTVLAFTFAVSALVGALFGLAPAFKLAGSRAVLRHQTRGASGFRNRVQGAFVAAQMALALVLLIGAGLMVRTLANLLNTDPGFSPAGVLTFSLAPPPGLAEKSPETIRAGMRHFHDRLSQLPGVRSVAFSWECFPLLRDAELQFWIEGQPKPASQNDMSWALHYIVGPEYFSAMQINLVRGRYFTAADDEHAPRVAVVDERLAAKYFPGQDPLGKRLITTEMGPDKPVEIVGIVRHVKQWGLDIDDQYALQAQYYGPLLQVEDKDTARLAGGVLVALKTGAIPTSLFEEARHMLSAENNETLAIQPATMDQIISQSVATPRFSMVLMSIFAGLALLLAGIGIYGVVSYVVSQRTNEIGVRMALGADRSHVLRLVLGHGTRMAIIGLTLGFIAALGLSRLISGMLYGVKATDPLTFICVALLLCLVALLACFIPARRASRVEPTVALRYE